ncbi:MAG: hypothetical protein QOH25_1489 [Acidobacteriota bacterium]|jgi:hypothetical protein|nr:hypothetical protein [Acidobacteriota bacterium]
MPLSNDKELRDAIARISRDLQDMQDYLNKGGGSAVPDYILSFIFPSGYMRKTEDHHASYWFIRDFTLRSNISYNLVFYDLLKWVHERVQLRKPAYNMIIKHMIIVIGAVCEVLALQVVGKGKFEKLIDRLKDMSIIDAKLEAELDWLRDARNLIHYDKQQKYELDHYKPSDLQRAIKALENLTKVLSSHCEADPTYDDLKKRRKAVAVP